MWNSVIAGVVFRHESIEKLIEELSRNGQLRYICGFRKYKTVRDEQGRVLERKAMIPKPWNYSRFLSELIKEQELVDEMFDKVLEEIMELLPEFGRMLAIDGKAINSYAKRENKNTKEDGRRDLDANTGIKQYSGIREDGTKWEKVVSWFGYKLHLVIDAEYELPVAYSVMKASASEIREGKKLIEELSEKTERYLKGVNIGLETGDMTIQN